MSGNLKKTKEDRFLRSKRKRSRLRGNSLRKVISKVRPKTTQKEKIKRQQIQRGILNNVEFLKYQLIDAMKIPKGYLEKPECFDKKGSQMKCDSCKIGLACDIEYQKNKMNENKIKREKNEKKM